MITIVSAASDIPEDSETETATELHSEGEGSVWTTNCMVSLLLDG